MSADAPPDPSRDARALPLGTGVTLHRGPVAGCIGRITELHATHYAATAGFGVAFEAQVATGLAAFCVQYAEGRDGLWLLRRDGRIEGSVAIDGTHAATDGAHLRWFIVSDALRGQGHGRALLRAALAFADTRGCARTFLWTFAGLDAARHLYETHGFVLEREQAGDRWGRVVQEQRFVRRRP